MDYFARFQHEIRLAERPDDTLALPWTTAGLEALAMETMESSTFDYIAGSASSERTAAANLDAFTRRRIVPRMLRGSAAPAGRDLSVEVLGTTLSAPVLTAPVGALELVHEDGAVAVASVTRELGIGSVLSTVASSTIEQVGAAAGPNWWFQLYWPSDDDIARSFVERAERSGAKAIVVTIDAPSIGWRPRDHHSRSFPMLQGKGVANYLSDPVFLAKNTTVPTIFGNHALRMSDIGKLRDWTDLPVAVKGVLHPDDARALVDAGAQGIVVSNHGGRQVDGAIAALDALGPIVDAVGDRAEVLFDSGVRTGSDILVAVALGAKAVLYGRPWVYGLGLAGKDGVRHALRLLLADFDITMGLSGFRTLDGVDRSIIATFDSRT